MLTKPLTQLEPSWPELKLRIDVRNLVGPNEAGKLTVEQLDSRVEANNLVWAQCGIRFIARARINVTAGELGIPYEPKSEEDLSKIAVALNPHGFDGAVPLTVAGPWQFYDPHVGLWLHGLGWVFTLGQKIDRIGAMVSALRIFLPTGGAIIAHELAHALSLPHVAESDNLMGPGGTNTLTLAQCRQARNFSETALADFVVAPATVARAP